MLLLLSSSVVVSCDVVIIVYAGGVFFVNGLVTGFRVGSFVPVAESFVKLEVL